MLPTADASLSWKFPLFPEMSVWDGASEVATKQEMHRMLFRAVGMKRHQFLSEQRAEAPGEETGLEQGSPVCHGHLHLQVAEVPTV